MYLFPIKTSFFLFKENQKIDEFVFKCILAAQLPVRQFHCKNDVIAMRYDATLKPDKNN